MLETYAVTEEKSKGRKFPVIHNTVEHRNEFQRDYSRVLNSASFRKLRQKTQVYASDIGNDIARSRLDHSMEVAEIAKTISRSLKINEYLAGVLGLSHDLGHAPFGHLGQDILNDLMKDHGGFEHNIQSLRIVDELETPYYPLHVGLNLMYESREGLLKHCSKTNAIKLGDIAIRHLRGKQSFLEAQVVDWSDAISYLHADLEDAFSLKILTTKHFEEIPQFMESFTRLKNKFNFKLPTEDDFLYPKTVKQLYYNKGVIKYVINNMLSNSVVNLINTSKENIYSFNIKTVDDVKNHPTELIRFSDKMLKDHKALKKFSRENIYNNPLVLNERKLHKEVISTLFNYYIQNINLLSLNSLSNDPHQITCDYIAGMTDRYATLQYKEIIKFGKVLDRNERLKEKFSIEELVNEPIDNKKDDTLTKNKQFKF